MRLSTTLCTAAIAALSLFSSSVSAANVVLNSDFSANAASFTVFPGYLGGGSNPSTIPNWTFNSGEAGNGGINGTLPGLSNPFGPADKSAASTWGFLQITGNSFTQTLTLAASTTYDLSFLAANRSSNANALGRVLLADDSTTYFDSTVTNWGTSQFQAVTDQFSTGASFDGNVVLTLSNNSPAGDNTVNYSNLVIDAVAQPNPIPEPSSAAVLCLGGIVLLLRRRLNVES